MLVQLCKDNSSVEMDTQGIPGKYVNMSQKQQHHTQICS